MASGIQRKALSISDKLDILKESDEGLTQKKKQKDIVNELRISPSTLRTLLKNRHEIEQSTSVGGSKRQKLKHMGKIEAKEAIQKLKETAKNTQLTTHCVVGTITSEITQSAAGQLPSLNKLKRTAQRVRKIETCAPPIPKSLNDLNIPDEYRKATSEGMNSEPPMKKQSASERLSDSNEAAWNMVGLASKKLNIKSNYYDKKLILLQQNNNILRNIHTLLETYVQNKTRSRERKRRRSRDRGCRVVEYDGVKEIPVTKSRDKYHESERKRKQRSCSRDRESKKDRKESDHHRRDKSKDRRDEHDKDNSERDDKIHTKQEPVVEYDNNYENYYNNEYDGYNSPHDDYDPYLVNNEKPDEENANGCRYSNYAM